MKKWFPWILVVALSLYIFKMDREVVTIPPRSNTKVIINPMPIKSTDTLLLSDGVRLVGRIQTPDSALLARYQSLQDSVDRLNAYIDAITEREYVEKLEDSVQTIEVYSRVSGWLKEQRISYQTKPTNINVKKSDASFYVGPTLSMSGIKPTAVGVMGTLTTKRVSFSVNVDNLKSTTIGVSFKLF